MSNNDTMTVPGSADAEVLASDIERLGERLRQARQSIERVIFGQQAVIDQTLIALLSGGHVLLIGVPGLAKTRLVETLHVVLGLEERRVQCTPDLMPADILGSEVLEEEESGRPARTKPRIASTTLLPTGMRRMRSWAAIRSVAVITALGLSSARPVVAISIWRSASISG